MLSPFGFAISILAISHNLIRQVFSENHSFGVFYGSFLLIDK